MKKRFFLLTISMFIVLCLSSCMFSPVGEYNYETDHKSKDVLSADVIAGDIEDFYDLRNAVSSCIKARVEDEVLIISNYQGNLERDMKKLREEVLQVQPMGVYAVDDFKYEQLTDILQQEVRVSVDYKLSAEDMAKVVKTDGISDFEKEISAMFENHQTKKAFLVNNFTDDKETFDARVLKCWLMSGAGAMPVVSITEKSFPEKQKTRIVELNIEYAEKQEDIAKKQDSLGRLLQRICQYQSGNSLESRLNIVQQYVGQNVVRIEQDSDMSTQLGNMTEADTAYGALVGYGASDLGVVSATLALCTGLKLDAEIMQGTNAKEPYAWVYLRSEGIVLDPMGDGREYILPLEKAIKQFQCDEKIYSFN